MGVQAWGPRAAGTDWERPSVGCGGKTSSGPWDVGGWLVVVAAVVVVRWPAEPMQQEVKDWKEEEVMLGPQPHAVRGGLGARGIRTSWREGKRSCAVFRRCSSV